MTSTRAGAGWFDRWWSRRVMADTVLGEYTGITDALAELVKTIASYA